MATKEINLKELLESKATNMATAPEEREDSQMQNTNGIVGRLFGRTGDDMAAMPSLDDAREMDDEMARFIGDVLVEGTDYGMVRGAKRPSLFKPGAERLCRFMGLTAVTHITSRYEDFENGLFSYEAKVSLVDADGVIRGEGCGSCNTRENKYIKTSAYNNANTCLKMARKRAFVDATLSTAAVSGFFTQDVEDLPEVTGSSGKSSSQERTATPKQIDFLMKLMERHNTSVDSMNAYIRKNYGVDSIKEISSGVASELIDKFRSVA